MLKYVGLNLLRNFIVQKPKQIYLSENGKFLKKTGNYRNLIECLCGLYLLLKYYQY